MKKPTWPLAALLAVSLCLGAQPAGASAGPAIGRAQSFPTHCGVESLTAGHEGNVWFACTIATHHDYGTEEKVGRITPAGAVTEFGGLPNNLVPGQIITAPDGNFWVPLSSLHSLLPQGRLAPVLARITPAGEVTIYRPPGLGSEYNILELVASPNGYLWFTAGPFEAGKEPTLWQVAPDGAITQVQVGLSETVGVGLAVGPEGNLWFNEKPASGPAEGVIARLAPDGTVSEFGAGISGFAPRPPLLAPDGSFYFLTGTSKGPVLYPPTGAGRITSSGEISDTGAKLAGSGIVGDTTIGSDGNLWFSFQSGRRGKSAIERVTPSGVTVFRDCLRYSQPYFGPDQLAVGGDGNIWFTSVASRMLPGIEDPSSIGRITPSGEIVQLYAGVNAEARWIAAGPDGAVWFSAGFEEIQRIEPLTAPVNTFHVGPLRHTAPSGAAAVNVAVPGPGRIQLKPLSLLLRHRRTIALPGRSVTLSTSGCATARLRLKPVGAALKAFRRHGEAVERVAVTFTPRGGTPYTIRTRLSFYNPHGIRRGGG